MYIICMNMCTGMYVLKNKPNCVTVVQTTGNTVNTRHAWTIAFCQPQRQGRHYSCSMYFSVYCAHNS